MQQCLDQAYQSSGGVPPDPEVTNRASSSAAQQYTHPARARPHHVKMPACHRARVLRMSRTRQLTANVSQMRTHSKRPRASVTVSLCLATTSSFSSNPPLRGPSARCRHPCPPLSASSWSEPGHSCHLFGGGTSGQLPWRSRADLVGLPHLDPDARQKGCAQHALACISLWVDPVLP